MDYLVKNAETEYSAIRRIRSSFSKTKKELQYKAVDNISEAIKLLSAFDIASLAVEARTSYNLDFTSLYISVEMFNQRKDVITSTNLLRVIIDTPYMMCKWLDIYWNNGKRPIPAQVKRVFSSKFNTFTREQFKECRKRKGVEIRDVMFMVHPKPTSPDQEELFTLIANNKL